ncbi:hypothetical protein Mapa_013722 [Marchantia paleacea]|nr:hypothetical protein Mapa_013722 [Marchantia paleacea]
MERFKPYKFRCSKVTLPPGRMDASVGRPELPGTTLHSVLTSAVFCSSSFSFTSTTIPPSLSSSGRGFTSILENKASPFTFLRAFLPASMLKTCPGLSWSGSSRPMICILVTPSQGVPILSKN